MKLGEWMSLNLVNRGIFHRNQSCSPKLTILLLEMHLLNNHCHTKHQLPKNRNVKSRKGKFLEEPLDKLPLKKRKKNLHHKFVSNLNIK